MKEPVLIVDDNPDNLKLLVFLLTKNGYDVRTACDAEQALASLRESLPRLILMDVQLPGMDGLELTRRLKADPATAHILIVAVTAYAMKSNEEKALAAGCDGYLAKVFQHGITRQYKNWPLLIRMSELVPTDFPMFHSSPQLCCDSQMENSSEAAGCRAYPSRCLRSSLSDQCDQ